jgi:poly-D-alanine transfer protein DltD
MNASKLLALENIIKSIEMERVTLNTTHSSLSEEMKQVIKATLIQSKEINAMQTEMGSIYSMLKDIHRHFMPNIRPLPPQLNYAEIRANTAQISLESPSNNPSPLHATKYNRRSSFTTPAFKGSGLRQTEFYARF